MSDLPGAGADLNRLRELNTLSVLRALRDSPPSTVTELATRSGLSRPSADGIVQDLVGSGWASVTEAGGSSLVGRPARRYQFRAQAGHVLGVDVGGHKMLAMVTDLDGQPVATARHTVSPEAEPAARLAAMDATITEALQKAGLTTEELWAITAGVTGPVDATGRTTLFTPLPGWSAVDLIKHLGDRYPCPIQVENDCKLAAVAERWRGVAQDADDIVYVLAGMRTGAGLIIDGTLRRGYGGAAGEIGALRHVKWLNAPSHLENHPGIPETVATDDKAEWVFAAARSGDKDALGSVRRYVKDLAIGTAALVLTLDPQVVVVGGGFSRSADLIIGPLAHELKRLSLRMPELRTSELGDESVVLGAIRLSLDEINSRLFTSALSAPVAPRRDA